MRARRFTGERLHEGASLFAVDMARHQAAYELALHHGRDARVLDLGFVVSFQVIEHLRDPSAYLEAIARVLRPEGVAILTTPNLLMSDGVNPYHVHEYTSEELETLLARHFEDVEMQGVGMSPPVRDYMEARSARIRKIMRLDPLKLRERLPQPLIERLFAFFALVVRRRTQEGDGTPDASWRDFPIGEPGPSDIDLVALCRAPHDTSNAPDDALS
jgi:SAM-dependent methyltransferase